MPQGTVAQPPNQNVLSIERDGHVATLWLDRPHARNALGRAFWVELPVAMGALSTDPGVRAVVIAARGPHFTVGLDLKELGGTLLGTPARSPAGRASAARASILRMQAAIGSVAACAKPVIAAVHGYCIGGGVDLVAACDIRLASSDAVFSVRETKMAIVADLGSLQRLPGIIGSGHVAELAFTGKDVGAARAKEIGLVNEVYDSVDDLHAGAHALAAEIAALSPLAVQGTKAVLAARSRQAVADGLDYVATWNAAMLVSDDLAEALAAFSEKRAPHFEGR